MRPSPQPTNTLCLWYRELIVKIEKLTTEPFVFSMINLANKFGVLMDNPVGLNMYIYLTWEVFLPISLEYRLDCTSRFTCYCFILMFMCSYFQLFHVAYVLIKFANSPRPDLWVLERSVDFGRTYTPWQYFARKYSIINLFSYTP